ncbi:MAG: aminotransferase class I/II-fold pyridoxal phosphate-dependent enzyme, partial [Burkholderiales bacterium]|nr:aminotransferase class I/II-fold pyridoxal phosphate-dependent enzyme [Burkholderiales bacterium]
PNNPTGWMLSRGDRAALLAHCRRHGIWIVSDDAYERLHYEDDAGLAADPARAADSFLDVAEPGDRIVATNTFSKSWLMTGWRLGWIVAPDRLVPQLAKLVEYNTSCAPGFVQRAGIAAIAGGEPVIARTVTRFRAARDHLVAGLRALPGVAVATPPGAMYLFFAVTGMRDSLAFCRDLVARHGLGLAPGVAFGAEGEGFLRWCFASDPARLDEGLARLRAALDAPR